MTGVLERGEIFFLYRPRVERAEAHSLDDVQRLYLILHPRDLPLYRRLVIGRKRMPGLGAHERYWAFVDRVAASAERVVDDLREERYFTRTRGVREIGAARPAGEGVYAIAAHDAHTHLVYRLELPHHPGAVQRELGIEPEASYIVAVRNPEAAAPPGVGLPGPERAEYTRRLRERFGRRRFAPLIPAFLDEEGTEIVLIGAGEHVREELGIDLDADLEAARASELFEMLVQDRLERPIAPLIAGEWI